MEKKFELTVQNPGFSIAKPIIVKIVFSKWPKTQTVSFNTINGLYMHTVWLSFKNEKTYFVFGPVRFANFYHKIFLANFINVN